MIGFWVLLFVLIMIFVFYVGLFSKIFVLFLKVVGGSGFEYFMVFLYFIDLVSGVVCW